MKKKVWNIPPVVPIPEELVRAGYPPLLAAVLAARGILTPDAAGAFLDSGPCALGDPMQMVDMDRAVARIRLAAERGERVAVYGDYDVDGITSACLLTEYLRGLGLETIIYIPDRIEEGYGLNINAIDRLRSRGVSLIITVDCGVTAIEETAHANALGVDMLITDHHECQSELPAASAVVDPKRPDRTYPNRDLAGVGVAFKLVCALEGDSDKMLARFSDLVAVGTIADVMPLTGENRIIVKAGLEKLRTNPCPGLAALIRESGMAEKRLNAMSVGYTLAPRINAAGRLGRVSHAADLILEQDPVCAGELAAELCRMNRERQQLEADIWTQALEMLDNRVPDRPIVLAGEGWHQGVIGIAASRLAETFSVPAVMISLDGNRGKGSCRSFGGFNLFDALSSCGDLLDGFGGHALAAGLNIQRENIDRFRTLLGEYYATHDVVPEEGLSLDVIVDNSRMLTMRGVESLELLEPCGNENPRPVFGILDALVSEVTPIGGGKHTRLRLEKFGQSYDCIWFSRRSDELGVSAGERADCAFYPQVSEFRGRQSIQLVIQDMRPADFTGLCARILTGGEVNTLFVTRNDLVRVWRSLEELAPLCITFARLGQLEPRLHPAKIAMGLRIFHELSLASVTPSEERGEVRILLTKSNEKTDLMLSPSWRKYHR